MEFPYFFIAFPLHARGTVQSKYRIDKLITTFMTEGDISYFFSAPCIADARISEDRLPRERVDGNMVYFRR